MNHIHLAFITFTKDDTIYCISHHYKLLVGAADYVQHFQICVKLGFEIFPIMGLQQTTNELDFVL